MEATTYTNLTNKETMTFRISNTNGYQQPLGDRPLNYSVTNTSDMERDSGSGLKMQNVDYKEIHCNRHLQSSSVASKSYTPNERKTPGGRSSAPFKSPITLCFDRMLGAGKFARRVLWTSCFHYLTNFRIILPFAITLICLFISTHKYTN